MVADSLGPLGVSDRYDASARLGAESKSRSKSAVVRSACRPTAFAILTAQLSPKEVESPPDRSETIDMSGHRGRSGAGPRSDAAARARPCYAAARPEAIWGASSGAKCPTLRGRTGRCSSRYRRVVHAPTCRSGCVVRREQALGRQAPTAGAARPARTDTHWRRAPGELPESALAVAPRRRHMSGESICSRAGQAAMLRGLEPSGERIGQRACSSSLGVWASSGATLASGTGPATSVMEREMLGPLIDEP